MTTKCNSVKRCMRATCYDCRADMIHATAKRMVQAGEMTAEQASDYRYSALSMLEFEIPITVVVTPKPKARKASKADTFDPSKVVAMLREAKTMDEARWALAGLSMAKLRLVAASHTTGLRAPSKLRAAELREYVATFTAGMRLSTNAILNAK